MQTQTPTNLRQLAAFLTEHPRLRCEHPLPGMSGERLFVSISGGFLRMQDGGGEPMQLPLMTVDGQETGLVLHDDGFDFKKSGTVIRFTYAVQGVADETLS
jgi:hypothetical protein